MVFTFNEDKMQEKGLITLYKWR